MPARSSALLAPAALALLFVGVHLACGGAYGFFRDELYFVACGQRLAWGYVDQPPLIAAVARLAWWLSSEGGSVLLFRLPAYLAGAGSVLVAALVARRLGGGTFAMALASAATFGAALQHAQAHLLTMNVFELLLWNLVALAALAALDGRPRLWLVAGALLGLALLTKYSAGLLAVALLAGLVATPARRALASGWLWGGVALAVLLALPSLWWQVQHGLPFAELLANGRLHKNAEIGPAALLGGLLLEQGPIGLLLAAGGAAWLLSRRAERSFLGVAMLLVLGTLALLGSKPYYLGPGFPPLFAGGAVLAERRLWASGALRAGLVALVAAMVLPGLPLAIPIVSPEAVLAWQERLGIRPTKLERGFDQPLPQHFADQLGWPERVAAVAEVVRTLPAGERARAVIYTTNYGRAAALQLLGARLGLPPVVSGHNQYFLWGVPGEPQVVVALGGRGEEYARDFEEMELIARTPAVAHGMSYESEVPIFVLRRPRAPVAELFRSAKNYQ